MKITILNSLAAILQHPLFLLFASIIFCSACRKDPEKGLPAATRLGLNTLGCKVNGENWIPGSDDWKATYLQSSYIISENKLRIYASRSRSRSKQNNQEAIVLVIDDFPANAGVYELNSRDASVGNYSYIPPRPDPLIQTPREDYFTDPAHRGHITITYFDRANRIVSGHFEFKAKHESSPATVSITHGRFDLKFYEYQ